MATILVIVPSMPSPRRSLIPRIANPQLQLPGMDRAEIYEGLRALFRQPVWTSPASAFFASIQKSMEKPPFTPDMERNIVVFRKLVDIFSFPIDVANYVWRYLWSAAFIVASMVLIAWATGGLDRLAPVAMGYGAISPGAPAAEWFNPAPSAFVRHATKEDGTFDIDLLKTKLQAAGIAPDAARQILIPASTGYQNLLLVDDPQARKEMLARAHASNVELEKALDAIGGDRAKIVAALDQGKSTKQSSAAEAMAWKTIKEFNPESFLVDIGSPGVKSLADRFKHIQQYNAQASNVDRPAWPIARVVAIGVNANGDWDGTLLTNRMRDAGINQGVAQTMLMAVERHLAPADSLPVSVAVPLTSTHLDVIGEAYKAGLKLDREHAQLFLTRHRMAGETQFRGLDNALPGVPDHLRQRAKLQLDWEDKQWAKIIADMSRGYAPQRAPAGLDMQTARDELARVAAAVGLRSLSLPNASFSSAENIWEIAKGLERANSEIESATGWKGPVLGLGGRVDLALRTPVHIGAMGAVLHMGDGRVTMSTGWPAMGHEWFHALDMVAGQHALDVPLFHGLSSSEHNKRYARLPDLVEASFRLNQDLHETPSAWRAARMEGDLSAVSPYFTKNTEMTASAFASWLSARPDALMLGTRHVELQRIESPEYVLDDTQFDRLSPRFEQYFRTLDGMDWTGRPGPATARIHEPSIVMRWIGADIRGDMKL